ncbi:MAG: posphoenolpyruvate synthetase regulatory kinase/phosphorylase PpsR [bacterium]
MSDRPVFIVSDRSGLTAETISHTLLSQFPGIDFSQVAMPFVDTKEKVQEAVQRINQEAEHSGQRPLVFTTFVDENFTELLAAADAEVFDLFAPFINRIETALGQQSSHQPGQSHGIANLVQYNQRINAVNYAMHCDDGLHPRDYAKANMILLGASRSGKTPTCLYLALQFGFYAANYPLTEEDFIRDELPPSILDHRDRVFGLTIDPGRLHQIRSERRPGSRYASLKQCQQDVNAARRMYERYRIPHCDSTNYSVEELGSTIKHQMDLQPALY